jgi:magnesium chelatase family protein
MIGNSFEDKVVTICRAQGSFTFPANFMLVAAMNPCPCGYYNDPVKECTCSLTNVLRYRKRISGPLLDRIDTRSASKCCASITKNSPATD